MEELLLGVNLPGGTSFSNLEKELERITNDGFTVCEINLGTYPLIIGGKFVPKVAEYILGVLNKFPLVYTAHMGYGLDLRNTENHTLNKSVLNASIEACAALNIKILNIHYEEKSKYYNLEKLFEKSCTEAADYAGKLGITLCLENIETEVAFKSIELVKKINHPHLRATLDTGHLFLSANLYKYDLFEAVESVLPVLSHLHINDNTGDFEMLRLTSFDSYKILDRGYRFAYSSGDIHIPPLWGSAPIKEIISCVKKSGYQGVWLCEYYSESFTPFNKDIRRNVHSVIKEA